MNMIDKRLPKFCYSSSNFDAVEGSIIHYFSCIKVDPENAFSMKHCWDLFIDLNSPRSERKRYMKSNMFPEGRMYASAHILIGRDGEEHLLVPLNKKAYHAGHSILNNKKHCNDFTHGIELVGTINSGFEEAQYVALAKRQVDLMRIHGYGIDAVKGHDTVRWAAIQAGLTTDKKYDPSGRYNGEGNNFDWEKLHELIRKFSSQ